MSEELKNVEEHKRFGSTFIHDFIEEDIAPEADLKGKKVHTRFPPGTQRIFGTFGHAKALYIDFATAEKYNVCVILTYGRY